MSKIKVLIILSGAVLHRSLEQQLTSHFRPSLHASINWTSEHVFSGKQPFEYPSADTPPFLTSSYSLAQRLVVGGQVSSFLTSSQSPQLLVLTQV